MHVIRTVIAGIWILWLAAGSAADTYMRQQSVDVLHYDIALELTDVSDTIAGTTRLEVLIRGDSVSKMWLDFESMTVDKLTVGETETAFVYREGRLLFNFDRTYSMNETVWIEIQYHGKPGNNGMRIGENAHGRRVFFTDSWPDLAHHWFPSIDHPSDKATVDVTVTAPEKYDVVSNGRLVATQSIMDGRKLTHWSESNPIPTYCVAVGVAEFLVSHQKNASGTPLAWYSYPQNAEAAAQKFSRTALALEYFESIIGPYPYEKLAQVQAGIREGGMENASAIFYNESYFLEMPVSEFPVPHEIAHQWFGDSVTESDWDHLWLSEGFATYFEALFYAHLEGSESLKRIMASNANRLKEYAGALSSSVIDSEQTDLMKKLNPLNYEKGAWILHMLRGLLGDETFFKGIRLYYRSHAGESVLSEDFQKAMESVSGTGLNTFFKQWLYQPGWPEYVISWQWDATAGEADITLKQTQTTGLFDTPLDIAFSDMNHCEVHTFTVTDAVHNFRIPLKFKPEALEVDPEDRVLKSVEILRSSRP